jgi:hypothetical protein
MHTNCAPVELRIASACLGPIKPVPTTANLTSCEEDIFAAIRQYESTFLDKRSKLENVKLGI